jgi:hypothetical protein
MMLMTVYLTDKSNYQSTSTGTDKHKYGYELKDNNHFHHTTTGKVSQINFLCVRIFDRKNLLDLISPPHKNAQMKDIQI